MFVYAHRPLRVENDILARRRLNLKNTDLIARLITRPFQRPFFSLIMEVR